jgi:membrane-associated phospholipid phosphatase
MTFSPSTARTVLSVMARVAVVVLFFAVWWTVYQHVNAFSADPVRTIRLRPPKDYFPDIIQPWTALIYFFGGLLLPVLPFLYHRTWPRLGFVLTCYAISSALAFLTYSLWPLSIDRPAFDEPGTGNALMHWLVSVDQAGNCCPSSHVLFAVLGALLVSTGGAGLKVTIPVWVLAVCVCATTITTGQHYLLDIPGGVVAALAGYGGARALQAARGGLMPATETVEGSPGGPL